MALVLSSFRYLSLAVGLSLGSLGAQAAADSTVEIRWTGYGIPHIRATDERGLGYGIGYAYARDNACLLLEEAMTARGERSRYLGEAGSNSAGMPNLASDVLFGWINDEAAVRRFERAQPATLVDRLDGYVAGFNRYLHAPAIPLACADEPWARPLVRADLVRLTRRLLVEGGLAQFGEGLLAASQPRIAAGSGIRPAPRRLRQELGSNAIAVGSARAAGARSLLLANPHFPWRGALRFYQLHLTLPGQLDVMGAALPGLPLVNIGFNRHLAWTHTVDTAAHFTLYRLALDPRQPRHYLVDGQSLPLREDVVKVVIRTADGRLETVERSVWVSRFGPLIRLPGQLDETATQAWALRDANLDNSRVLAQWDAINRADSTVALTRAIATRQGIPWVNTLAADDRGQVAYLDLSVVPYLDATQLQACLLPELAAQGLPGLRGDLASCHWRDDPDARQPGIVPTAQQPQLSGNGVLQNSNDSAWLTDPARPLEGFSPLVSRAGEPLGGRTRYALSRLAGMPRVSADELRKLVVANQVASRDWVWSDLRAYCARPAHRPAVRRACQELADWDGTANLTAGPGLQVFAGFLQRLSADGSLWRRPFDPADPLHTPTGIDLARDGADERLGRWLTEALAERLPRAWGEVQLSAGVGIPGGDGHLGIYNAIQSQAQGDQREVVSGSSYIQLVRFTADGPQARGLLAFSQSSDPRSPHYRDQTLLFSRQQWPVLPFTERQIQADPQLQRLRLIP
ncbi:penicillin acylase family protein [Pseudomonas oryzihabitans]|uniref:Acyl-homoserine-lactone acylase n=1 Tax=Pseudomonas oryzihabitans TaxID=47885 RepID=A0AAJ2BME9_9PSED|nr:acyl-homoserine-lactone acylase [Pseudomonas psychrotolerans]